VLPLITANGLALRDDVIVLNFGLWHGEIQRPRYIQHLHELGEFYEANREAFPNMFFMQTPKQHFAAAGDGDYMSSWLTDPVMKKGPYECGPIANVEYLEDGTLRAGAGDKTAEMVANGTWRNMDAARILQDKYGMRLVPVYNTTVAFWNMHRRNFAGPECRCVTRGGWGLLAVLCCAVLCCAVLCCAVLCCAVLCCAVMRCAVLWCAALARVVQSLKISPDQQPLH